MRWRKGLVIRQIRAGLGGDILSRIGEVSITSRPDRHSSRGADVYTTSEVSMNMQQISDVVQQTARGNGNVHFRCWQNRPTSCRI